MLFTVGIYRKKEIHRHKEVFTQFSGGFVTSMKVLTSVNIILIPNTYFEGLQFDKKTSFGSKRMSQ